MRGFFKREKLLESGRSKNAPSEEIIKGENLKKGKIPNLFRDQKEGRKWVFLDLLLKERGKVFLNSVKMNNNPLIGGKRTFSPKEPLGRSLIANERNWKYWEPIN